MRSGGDSSTVVASWTAGQQVELSILHQGHDAYQKLLISLGCPLASIALQWRIVA